MAQKFQVKTEKQATRCDICHQADQMDAFTGACMRCQALIVTNTVPASNASRYNDWMVTFRANNEAANNASLSSNELFRVIGEAAAIYLRNFLAFVGIIAIIQIPAKLLPLFISYQGWARTNTLLGFAISTIVPLILASLATGALNRAILQSYQREKVSILAAYRFILQRGPKYIVTSLLGSLFQVIGFFACYIGGLYTYPRGAFISEVAVAEEKYFMAALKRSIDLGQYNSISLLAIGLINWCLLSFSGGFGIYVADWCKHMLTNLPGFTYSYISLGSSLIPELIFVPLFLTIKMLLYFHLRMRDGDTLPVNTMPNLPASMPNNLPASIPANTLTSMPTNIAPPIREEAPRENVLSSPKEEPLKKGGTFRLKNVYEQPAGEREEGQSQ